MKTNSHLRTNARRSPKKSRRGYTVIWILTGLAVLTAAITSIEFTVDTRPQNPTMHAWFAVSMAIAIVGLAIEAKHDFYAFSMFSFVTAFITGIITGAVAMLGIQPHPIAGAVAAFSGLVMLASVIWLIRTQYGAETLPNILKKQFPAARIYEIEGVQFTVIQSATAISAGELCKVQVFVQNCWDQERTFIFDLAAETRIALNRAGLKFAPRSKLVLPAAGVGVLNIPVAANPAATGTHALVGSPAIEGTGGTRVRRWRGAGFSGRIPPWLTALGILGGILVWGGGLKVRLRVNRNGAAGVQSVELPETTAEIIWHREMAA